MARVGRRGVGVDRRDGRRAPRIAQIAARLLVCRRRTASLSAVVMKPGRDPIGASVRPSAKRKVGVALLALSRNSIGTRIRWPSRKRPLPSRASSSTSITAPSLIRLSMVAPFSLALDQRQKIKWRLRRLRNSLNDLVEPELRALRTGIARIAICVGGIGKAGVIAISPGADGEAGDPVLCHSAGRGVRLTLAARPKSLAPAP
jgi:hypothetical protein